MIGTFRFSRCRMALAFIWQRRGRRTSLLQWQKKFIAALGDLDLDFECLRKRAATFILDIPSRPPSSGRRWLQMRQQTAD